MKTLTTIDDQFHIDISRDELLIINAALNEICNGIEVFEFATRIGADRETVGALLNDVGALLDKRA